MGEGRVLIAMDKRRYWMEGGREILAIVHRNAPQGGCVGRKDVVLIYLHRTHGSHGMTGIGWDVENGRKLINGTFTVLCEHIGLVNHHSKFKCFQFFDFLVLPKSPMSYSEYSCAASLKPVS